MDPWSQVLTDSAVGSRVRRQRTIGTGGIETLEEQNKILIERGVSRVSPFTVPRLMVNAASGNVSILFKIHGPNSAVATACATGLNAIGDAPGNLPRGGTAVLRPDGAVFVIGGGVRWYFPTMSEFLGDGYQGYVPVSQAGIPNSSYRRA